MSRAKAKSRAKYATDAERNEARRIAGREAAQRQSAANQARRVAEGLPALAYAAEGRSFRYIDDPTVEAEWLAEAEMQVANYDELSWREKRRAAKRLSDAHAAREAAAAASGSEPPVGVDDRTLMTYWETEMQLWRIRSARDLEMAARHARMADNAERELGTLMLRNGGAR